MRDQLQHPQNWNNTRNKHLTKHDSNDDVDLDNCVVHTGALSDARRAQSSTLDVISHLIGSRSESCHKHLHSHPWAHLLDSPLPFYFYLFFPVFSFYLLHSELYPELDNPIVMESLCYPANKGNDDAYDVSTSLTERTGRPVIIDRSQKSQGKINALNNMDCVPSNVQSSSRSCMLTMEQGNL